MGSPESTWHLEVQIEISNTPYGLVSCVVPDSNAVLQARGLRVGGWYFFFLLYFSSTELRQRLKVCARPFELPSFLPDFCIEASWLGFPLSDRNNAQLHNSSVNKINVSGRTEKEQC